MPNRAELLEELLKLPAAERQAAVRALLESLEPKVEPPHPPPATEPPVVRRRRVRDTF